MALFGREARLRAEAFVREHGRSLERARLNYDSDPAAQDDVLRALSAYRNPDGGYGHGLEPDVRLADSSAICTSVALQVLAEVGAPPEDAQVRGAIAYLLRTQDATSRVWFQVPPHVDKAPHAPWWSHNPDPRSQFANPRAELVGAFYRFDHVAPAWLSALAEEVVAQAEARQEQLTAPDLVCYRRLAETPQLPVGLRERLLPPLRQAIERLYLGDAAWTRWAAMGMGPLELAPTPHSLFAELLADAVHAELDQLVAAQEADGSWRPQWKWGDDGRLWRRVEREWRGILTLRNLRALRAYGRLQAEGGDYPSNVKPIV